MKTGINVEISEGIATITLNRPDKLNAMTEQDYYTFADALYAIDKRDDVFVTVWQATGRMFSTGTDVVGDYGNADNTVRELFLTKVAPLNTDPTRALYSHSKILVAAVHGPVFGISAAYLGHFDFVYFLPQAFIYIPFTLIGMISEAGSSVALARRMGVAKAKEVLMLAKKMTADELLACGFINKIFPSQSVDSFHAAVRSHIQTELGGLDPVAVLAVKKLINAGLEESSKMDLANMRESYAQAERLASGVPAQRFAMIARKEIKHKL